MSSLLIDAVGVAAGLASMASFVPQIVKIVREKDASSVSLRMFAITVTAFVLWTTFGVLTGSWPVAVSNAVCLGLSGTVLALRLRYGGDGGGGQQVRPSMQRRPG
jgi:MtN3 and saliva related transmembrane protein